MILVTHVYMKFAIGYEGRAGSHASARKTWILRIPELIHESKHVPHVLRLESPPSCMPGSSDDAADGLLQNMMEKISDGDAWRLQRN